MAERPSFSAKPNQRPDNLDGILALPAG
jgi:hypothetical protein